MSRVGLRCPLPTREEDIVATTPKTEYLGSTVNQRTRVYSLRVGDAGSLRNFTVAIANRAFLSKRVRYQDAPEICFRKLTRELEAEDGEGMPSTHLEVSDAELDEYRESQTKKPQHRGRRPSKR